jgi:signal transduction histidine kinase
MMIEARRRRVSNVDATPETAPTLTTLRQVQSQQEAVLRWMSGLGPFVIFLVTWTTIRTQPAPGMSGRHLAIAIALGGFVLGGLAAFGTRFRPHTLHFASIGLLLASSLTLTWLQTNGVATVGIVISVLFISRHVRSVVSLPLTIGVVALIAVLIATSRHGSVTSALLDAALISGFYGMAFLARRLYQANEQAEQLLIELERSRNAEARAAGLAERQRLAREMHDVLAHSLSGLMLQLEGARMLAAENPADPRLPEAIERAHHLGKSGLEEARRAIGMLRDDDLPGPELIAGLAAHFQEDRNVTCDFMVTGEAHDLDPEARLAVYRVAQEALTNITKHADPERVEVRLVYEAGRTRLTVEDFTTNGKQPNADGDAGYGLTGMRERAELLGGELTTEATPSGFRVELEVPV